MTTLPDNATSSLQDLVIDSQGLELEDDPSEVTFATTFSRKDSIINSKTSGNSNSFHKNYRDDSMGEGDESEEHRLLGLKGASSNNALNNNKSNHHHPTSTSSTTPSSSSVNQQQQQRSIRNPLAPTKADTSARLETHLPMAQLQRSTTVLRGRPTEVQLLQKCFQDLQEHHRTQLVLLAGSSGVGKTALAQSLVMEPQPESTSQSSTSNNTDNKNNTRPSNNNKATMVQGKFDLMNRNEPYQAILMACQEMCGCLLEHLDSTNSTTEESPSSVSSLQALSDDIIQGLGSELSLLLDMMPILEEILVLPQNISIRHNNTMIESDPRRTRKKKTDNNNNETAKNRINYAFQTLIRIVARHLPGKLILFIDDLQWADMPSLEIVDAFLADMTNEQGIMVVGAYRSNEVMAESTHILHRFIHEWKTRHAEIGFDMTQIEIGNLSEPAVKALIQDMLRIDDDRVDELCHLCFQKTQGNAFFVKFFVSTLAEKGLLQFNFATMSWKWATLTEMEAEMPSSENVIDLLVAKLQQQSSPASIFVLQVAACVGSKFATKLLQALLRDLSRDKRIHSGSDENDDDINVQSILDDLVDEGYVERSGLDHYKFSHDKVQEACLQLLPTKEARDQLCQSIGRCLLKHFEGGSELEALLPNWIFTVTDLLNKSRSSLDEEVALPAIKMAELNSSACQRAISISAFEAASTYASIGISLLADNAWTEHTEMCIELYSNGAQAEIALGNATTMESYCHIVISQSHVLTEQKFRVYRALVNSIGMRLMAKEAADKCLEVLAHFRVTFPKHKVHVLAKTAAQLITIKASVKDFAENQLMDLPMMADPLRHELLGFLERLSTFLFLR